MRKIFIGGVLLFSISCSQHQPITSVQRVQDYLQTYTDSLKTALTQFKTDVDGKNVDKLQGDFEIARRYYKHLEPLTELYFPGFSDAINGPAIDESEVYEGKLVPPTGFQVVEEFIYPQTDTAQYETLQLETTTLASMTNRLDQLVKTNEITDVHVFHALRLELIRVGTLGIGGFDSPVALKSLQECDAALSGVLNVAKIYQPNSAFEQLQNAIALGRQHLKGVTFDEFDRARFIKEDLDVISKTLLDYQQSLQIRNDEILEAVNMEKFRLFDADLIRPDFFANPLNRETKPELIALGKALFFDPVLSGNHQRSCASCHQPGKAFTDGRQKSVAFEGKGVISRNAPTIVNSFFQRVQFYDSRTMFLEDQASDVISNPTELHSNMAESVIKIKESTEYVELFVKSFGDKKDPVTERNLKMALAAYVRSLSSMNSPFDKYMRGETNEIPAGVVSGFNLFMGKAKCSICHFPPLFNGSIPPMYLKSESEVLGVPFTPDTVRATLDPDPGKARVFPGDANIRAFKTPTVRNASLTGPYMHNGVFSTIEEVIDFYDRGGGFGLGFDLPNQTLPPDKLTLTKEEKKNLILFIQSLTDTTGLTSQPRSLPAFKDAKLASRKVGGVY